MVNRISIPVTKALALRLASNLIDYATEFIDALEDLRSKWIIIKNQVESSASDPLNKDQVTWIETEMRDWRGKIDQLFKKWD